MASGEPTYKSAVVLMPPPALWDRLQVIRAFNDKGYVRWPPHICLLYGFLPDTGSTFEDAAATIRTVLASMQPFWVRLGQFGFFQHGAKNCTVWLHPQPEAGRDAAVLELQAALATTYPTCNEVGSISPRGFRPHLSVGQWGGLKNCEKARAQLQAEWDTAGPLDWLVDRVSWVIALAHVALSVGRGVGASRLRANGAREVHS